MSNSIDNDVLQKPTNKLVDEYIRQFDSQSSNSELADRTLDRLFKQFPENKNIEEILLKVVAINALYSTNIFNIYAVAKHIHQAAIDEGLVRGDPAIVGKIAIGHGIKSLNNKDRNFYSFATKYCSWHNPDDYPIFDSYIEKLLKAYRQIDFQFQGNDLKNYEKFKNILSSFQSCFNLKHYNFKQIDKFLWMYGKELFPNNSKIN